jgi:hypothetical protein
MQFHLVLRTATYVLAANTEDVPASRTTTTKPPQNWIMHTLRRPGSSGTFALTVWNSERTAASLLITRSVFICACWLKALMYLQTASASCNTHHCVGAAQWWTDSTQLTAGILHAESARRTDNSLDGGGMGSKTFATLQESFTIAQHMLQ